MAHRIARKQLKQLDSETLYDAHDVRRETGGSHRSRIREAHQQAAEDREQQILRWRLLKEAWKEPYRPTQEPRRDEVKALLRYQWCVTACLLIVIQVAFAIWFSGTYLEIPGLRAGLVLRALALATPGLLLAAAGSALFHRQFAIYDDQKRPKRALRRFAAIAALSSATGLTAIGAFLLTRHLMLGKQALVAGLGVPTFSLAAAVAASFHCAEILHRPNRLAARYDASTKLLGRLERLLEQHGGQKDRGEEELGQGGVRQGSSGAAEPWGDPDEERPVRGTSRPGGE